MIAQCPAPQQNKNFANTSKKVPKTGGPTRRALFHMKTRVSPKYPVTDCRRNAHYYHFMIKTQIANLTLILTENNTSALLK